MMRTITMLLVVGALCATASAIPAGADAMLNQYTKGWQNDPNSDMANISGSNAITVWSGANAIVNEVQWDWDRGPMNARIFDSNLNALTNEVMINTTLGGGMRFSSAMDHAGDSVVAWALHPNETGYVGGKHPVSGLPYSSNAEVRFNTVSGAGVPGAADVLVAGGGMTYAVNPWPNVGMRGPVVVNPGETKFVITWTDPTNLGAGRADMGHGTVYAQRYDMNYAPLGAPIAVNTTANASMGRVDVADDGSFVVAYSAAVDITLATHNMYVQRYDASGAPDVAGEILVSDQPYSLGNTQCSQNTISVNASGAFVVGMNFYTVGDGSPMFQQFDSSGNKIGPNKMVSAATAGGTNDQWVAVQLLDNGDMAIGWQQSGMPGGNGDDGSIRFFNSDGGSSVAEIIPFTYVNSNQRYGGMSMNADGECINTARSRYFFYPVGHPLATTSNRTEAQGAWNQLVAPRRGDADSNDYTDFNDILVVLNTANWQLAPTVNGFGWSEGDVNGDGITDFNDILIMLNTSNWLQGTPPSGPSIPEPATMSLLALGGLALIRRRRR